MESRPFISTRKSIKWGDNPAFENTSTLVLTTGHKYFVDIRVYPLPPSEQYEPEPGGQAFSIDRLEWAFAGMAQSTPATQDKPSHTVWMHWIDSKTTEEVNDEGDMWPNPNNPKETIERGAMVNPSSGKVEPYEEIWEDLELEGSGRGWVLVTEDVEKGVRGMLVRIGVLMQGVVRRGEEVSVGKWELLGGSQLNPLVQIGLIGLPLAVMGYYEMLTEFNDSNTYTQEEEMGGWPRRQLADGPKRKMNIGDKMSSQDGLEWECREFFEWG